MLRLLSMSAASSKALLALGLGIVLSACGGLAMAQSESAVNDSCGNFDSETHSLLYRSCMRLKESKESATTQQEEPTTLKPQKSILLSKPTISIPTITVPNFNKENWRGISWWNDTVGRQITSLLSKMIVETGEISVRDSSDSNYILRTEITNYKEVEEKTRKGGVSFFWIVGVKGGRNKVQSTITLNARIIDTTTNDIIQETSITGDSSRIGKGGGAFLNLGIINIEGEGSNEDVAPPIEEALQITLDKTVDYVRCVLVEKDSCLKDYEGLSLDL